MLENQQMPPRESAQYKLHIGHVTVIELADDGTETRIDGPKPAMLAELEARFLAPNATHNGRQIKQLRRAGEEADGVRKYELLVGARAKQ